MVERIARWSYHHRWRMLLIWIFALVGFITLGSTVGGSYSTDFSLPGAESQEAFDLLDRRFPQVAGETADIVFQWGWLKDLIGVDTTAPIEAWAPMMLFAILFGLSMDYEIFLLSRIREEYLRTGDNATAVANGLANTARVITAAAAIMVTLFLAFVFGFEERAIKLFGMGLAAAILVDATVVRMVLVPATMELLGDANWWFPRWLQRVLPEIQIEGEEEVVEHVLEETGGLPVEQLTPSESGRAT